MDGFRHGLNTGVQRTMIPRISLSSSFPLSLSPSSRLSLSLPPSFSSNLSPTYPAIDSVFLYVTFVLRLAQIQILANSNIRALFHHSSRKSPGNLIDLAFGTFHPRIRL